MEKKKGRKKLPNMMYNTIRTLNSPILQTLAFSPEKLTKVKFSILVSKAFVLSMVMWLIPFIQRTNDPMVGFLSNGNIFHLTQGKGFPSFPLVAFSVASTLIHTLAPCAACRKSVRGFVLPLPSARSVLESEASHQAPLTYSVLPHYISYLFQKLKRK